MKFKIIIGSLVLALTSVGVLGSPTNDFFFAGGVWKGSFLANCEENVTILDDVTMDVVPLSIKESDGVKTEYFTGILTAKNLPPDCVNIDFTKGVPLAKGTYVTQNTDSPYTGLLNILISTSDGIVPASFSTYDGLTIHIHFMKGNNSVDMGMITPK